MSGKTGVTITERTIKYRKERIEAVKQQAIKEGKENGETFYAGWLKGFAEGMEEITTADEAKVRDHSFAVKDNAKPETYVIRQKQTKKQKLDSMTYKQLMQILDDYWLSQPEEAKMQIDLHFQHANGEEQCKTLYWENILHEPKEKESYETTCAADIKEEDPPGWIM